MCPFCRICSKDIPLCLLIIIYTRNAFLILYLGFHSNNEKLMNELGKVEEKIEKCEFFFFSELISKLNTGTFFFFFFSELISLGKKEFIANYFLLVSLFFLFHFWWFLLENANFVSKQTFLRISKNVLKNLTELLENVNVAFIFWSRERYDFTKESKQREKEQQ